jgi:hypothetical protein
MKVPKMIWEDQNNGFVVGTVGWLMSVTI